MVVINRFPRTSKTKKPTRIWSRSTRRRFSDEGGESESVWPGFTNQENQGDDFAGNAGHPPQARGMRNAADGGQNKAVAGKAAGWSQCGERKRT